MYDLIVQFVIATIVIPWDNPTVAPAFSKLSIPPVDNIEMGKALLGVIIHPNAKGVSMNVTSNSGSLKKLIENGTL